VEYAAKLRYAIADPNDNHAPVSMLQRMVDLERQNPSSSFLDEERTGGANITTKVPHCNNPAAKNQIVTVILLNFSNTVFPRSVEAVLLLMLLLLLQQANSNTNWITAIKLAMGAKTEQYRATTQ